MQFIKVTNVRSGAVAGYVDTQGFLVGIADIRKDRLLNLVFEDPKKIKGAIKNHKAKVCGGKSYNYKPVSVFP